MDNTKGIRMSIESLLEDLWEEGYTIGQNDQWNEDEIKLNKEKADAYEKGHDKGFDKGYEAGSKDRGSLRNKATMRLDEESEAKIATRRLGCGIVFIKVTEDDDLKVIEFSPGGTEYLTTPATKPLSDILEETHRNVREEVSE